MELLGPGHWLPLRVCCLPLQQQERAFLPEALGPCPVSASLSSPCSPLWAGGGSKVRELHPCTAAMVTQPTVVWVEVKG